MRLVSDVFDPVAEIPFLNAGKGPGKFYVDHLSVVEARADGIPEKLDAIIAAGDLQGRERVADPIGNPPPLLGEVLPAQLANDILPQVGLAASRCGILLAGDLFTVPALDRRGGSGDVTGVWEAFAREFAWVVGVPGNHDRFGAAVHPSPPFSDNMHYLDNGIARIGGLRVAGLGGIIGRPRRPHRRSEEDYVHRLETLLFQTVDVVVTHDGPDVPDLRLLGSPIIRGVLERLQPPLVVRGHAYWRCPLAILDGGTQILNVDGRTVILRSVRRVTAMNLGDSAMSSI